MNGKLTVFLAVLVLACAGCSVSRKEGNVGQVQSYGFTDAEADWIRNGEPVEFEGQLWYPQDGIEILLDSEVQMIGEYRGLQVFVDKVDVRPYRRLYTKFGRNQFRYFESLKKP